MVFAVVPEKGLRASEGDEALIACGVVLGWIAL